MKYDVCIVGGSMVGASMALALAQQGHSVLLLEKSAVDSQRIYTDDLPFDLRVSALIPPVKRFFQQIGVWESIIQRRIQAFTKMVVWEGRLSDAFVFDAMDVAAPELGVIVENKVVQEALWEHIAQHDKITCIKSSWDALITEDKGVCITIAGQSYYATLLIGADGAQSPVRAWAGIDTQSTSYNQFCVVGSVQTERSHQNTCWQRYHNGLAFAFLPLPSGAASIAWYMSGETYRDYVNWNDKQILERLEKDSGGMLGGIDWVKNTAGFEIKRSSATQLYEDNIVLIGDAAHTVHPMAGQGANLGLIDAAVLAEEIECAQGDYSIAVPQYARRRKEGAIIQYGMDVVNAFFKPVPTPLELMRRSVLKRANSWSFLKHFMTSYGLGDARDLPASMRD